jgi:hypothetical protein
MLRKIILATSAAAALGAVALAPTSASAWGFHGGYGYWGHGAWFGPRVVFTEPYYGGCNVREWVQTPSGPQLRWVNRCY